MILINYHSPAAEARLSRWVDAALMLSDVQSLTVLIVQLESLLEHQGVEAKAANVGSLHIRPGIELRQGSEVLVTITEI
jgi:hypothetical protein